MTAPRRPPTDAVLERYLAGELSAELRASVEAWVADSPEVRARLESLRADSAAFLIKHPPGPVVAKLEPARRRWMLWLPLALASTAAALLVVLRSPEDESTTKGTIALAAFRQVADGGAELIRPGSTLREGDVVRFSVTAPSGFVAVLSRDGAGQVSIYVPAGGTDAVPFDATQPALPGATRLDAVKGRELVWALHGTTPFSLAPLVKQVEAGKDPGGPGLSVGVLGWEKE